MQPFCTAPVRVGLVGTGYAAKLRATALNADDRAQLMAVAGHLPETTQAFCATHQAEPIADWQTLVDREDLDLVIVATVNRDHGAIVAAALAAGKHVVVEYPLSLAVDEAEHLIGLAERQNRLLHVEHIELLSGIHQAVQQVLGEVGQPFYVRSTSYNRQQPAPQKWTYCPELFGFPLVGALSRLHRLMDLFGPVQQVHCQARFWQRDPADRFYQSCLCSAQLRFASGLLADLVYGKGEAIWQSGRTLDIQGDRGAIVMTGEQGQLILPEETRSLTAGSRRGLFAQDTHRVLDRLLLGTPLYVEPAASLAALRLADAAARSAATGQPIALC